jgi:hypothetical protein
LLAAWILRAEGGRPQTRPGRESRGRAVRPQQPTPSGVQTCVPIGSPPRPHLLNPHAKRRSLSRVVIEDPRYYVAGGCRDGVAHDRGRRRSELSSACSGHVAGCQTVTKRHSSPGSARGGSARSTSTTRPVRLQARADRRCSERDRVHPVLGFACLSGPKPPPPPPPPAGGKCAASYPTVCIPPPPPDLDCADVPYRNFRVRWDVPNPDPHHFDGNRNGIGCEA